MVLVLFCLASVWSNILSFNFALICFIANPNDPNTENTTTTTALPFREPDRTATQFNPTQKSYLTGAVALAALLANFPVVYLVNRFGIRTIFTFAGLISALATFFLPSAISWGFGYTLAARLLQGLAFACNFPAIGAFTGKWTYYKVWILKLN